METEIVQLIQNVGFPIAMCLLMFFRLDKSIRNNTKAIESLTLALDTKKL